MPFNLQAKTVAVFSHPNHEIAILATLRKLRPTIIFLTDGGGQHRLTETRNSLIPLGLISKAIFLNHTEQSFYDALLHLDSAFFMNVAVEVRRILDLIQPEQILCDAVEFYNPVHDIALPIVGAATDATWKDVYEIPLMYQKPGTPESYGVQTVPEGNPKFGFKLGKGESDLKKRALENTYTILWKSLGPVIMSAPDALKFETLFPASTPLRNPGQGYFLRYNQRAAHLMAKGQIKSEITHAYHFLPVVAELLRDKK